MWKKRKSPFFQSDLHPSVLFVWSSNTKKRGEKKGLYNFPRILQAQIEYYYFITIVIIRIIIIISGSSSSIVVVVCRL